MMSLASSSTLLFLFGDQMVGAAEGVKSKLPGATTSVPCSEVKVFKEPLAELLLAAAFWHLREQGVVKVEPDQKRVLALWKKQFLRVIWQKTGELPGIEGDLLRVAGSKAETSVEDVISRWFGQDNADPPGWVLGQIAVRSAPLGYFQIVETHRNPLAGLLLGKVKAEAACEQIGSARGAFEDVNRQWQAFQVAEPALHRALVDACRAGLNLRRAKRDSGGDF